MWEAVVKVVPSIFRICTGFADRAYELYSVHPSREKSVPQNSTIWALAWPPLYKTSSKKALKHHARMENQALGTLHTRLCLFLGQVFKSPARGKSLLMSYEPRARFICMCLQTIKTIKSPVIDGLRILTYFVLMYLQASHDNGRDGHTEGQIIVTTG